VNITKACLWGVCEPHVNSKKCCNICADNVTLFLYNFAANASSLNQINHVVFKNYLSMLSKDLLFRIDHCCFGNSNPTLHDIQGCHLYVAFAVKLCTSVCVFQHMLNREGLF
jgi:hypothetical protein